MAKGLIALGVIVFLAAAYYIVQSTVEKKVRQAIATPLTGINTGYDSRIGNVKVNLLRRSVMLKDVRITSMPSDTLSGEGFEVNFKKLMLEGVKLGKTNDKRSVKARKLRLHSPHVVLNTVKKQAEGKGTQQAESNAINKLKAALASVSVSVSRIEIEDGYFTYNVTDGDDVATYSLEDLDMNAAGFLADSVMTPKIFMCDEISFTADRFSYLFHDRMISVEADDIVVDTREGIFSVAASRVSPQIAQAEFAVKDPRHADWTKLESGGIKGWGIDYAGISAQGKVIMDSLSINTVNVHSYKNRKVYQKERIKNLFFQSVRDFPVKFDLGKVALADINVIYEEMPVEGAKSGTITFDRINGTFDRLTNIVTSPDQHMTLTAGCLLMNRTPLNAVFVMPLAHDNNRFHVSGRLSAIDATALNVVVEPLAKTRIESGNVSSMLFDIRGGLHTAEVSMTLLYKDLKIAALKEENGVVHKRRFQSWLADNIFLKTNNEAGEFAKSVTATNERNPHRSQFNYLWKSIYAGVEKTIKGL